MSDCDEFKLYKDKREIRKNFFRFRRKVIAGEHYIPVQKEIILFLNDFINLNCFYSADIDICDNEHLRVCYNLMIELIEEDDELVLELL